MMPNVGFKAHKMGFTKSKINLSHYYTNCYQKITLDKAKYIIFICVSLTKISKQYTARILNVIGTM